MKILLEIEVETQEDSKTAASALVTAIDDGIQGNIPEDMVVEIVKATAEIPVTTIEEYNIIPDDPIEELKEDQDENQY